MDDNRFQEIAKDVFGMSYYDFENQRFFDVDPQTKLPVSQEQKDMFFILQEASKTQIFEELIGELPKGTRISCRTSDGVGEDAKAHQLAGNIEFSKSYKDRTLAYNAATLVHELTHVVQHHQKSSSENTLGAKNRFVVNCLQEAEAKFNAERACFELFEREHPFAQEFQEETQSVTFFQDMKNRLKKGWNYKEREEDKRRYRQFERERDEYKQDKEMFGYNKVYYSEYKRLKLEGVPDQEIVKQVFESYWRDIDWASDYKRQFCEATKTDSHEYAGYEDMKMVLSGFQRRLGLKEEDMPFFLNPENLAGFESSWIEEATQERRTEKYIYDENKIIRQKDIEDNGNEYHAKYDEEGKKICSLSKMGAKYRIHIYEFKENGTSFDLMYDGEKLVRYNGCELSDGKIKKQRISFKDRESNKGEFNIEYDKEGLKKTEIVEKRNDQGDHVGMMAVCYDQGRKVKEQVSGQGIDAVILYDENGNMKDVDWRFPDEKSWRGEIDKEKVLALRECLLQDLPKEITSAELTGYMDERTFYEQTFQKWKKDNFEQEPEEPKLSMSSRISKLRGIGDSESSGIVQVTKLDHSKMAQETYTN